MDQHPALALNSDTNGAENWQSVTNSSTHCLTKNTQKPRLRAESNFPNIFPHEINSSMVWTNSKVTIAPHLPTGDIDDYWNVFIGCPDWLVLNIDLLILKTLSTHIALVKPLTHPPPGQNGLHFADDIFECIFMNDRFCILIQISPKFVPKGLVDNISGNGLAQNRWQAISWANVVPVHWSIYAALGGD